MVIYPLFDTISSPTWILLISPHIGISRNALRLCRSIFRIYFSFPTSGPEYTLISDRSITPSDTPTLCPRPPNDRSSCTSSLLNAAGSWFNFRSPITPSMRHISRSILLIFSVSAASDKSATRNTYPGNNIFSCTTHSPRTCLCSSYRKT